ncbi:MAG: Peptide chain release factor 2 [Synergistetes bacterium ADurb.BinA166]|nr:MAG: Peptide chain release factor 2 [Synergistetes bacterium ADurb.BinA166]
MYEKTCRTVFDLESIVRQKERLEVRTTDPGFWKSDESREVTREISRLQRSLDGWNEVERMYGDLAALDELLAEDDDAELQREFDRTAEKLRRFAEKEQMLILLSEEHDAENAILTIHAGSGGLDSQDWAEMLLRLYLRWIEREGFSGKVLDVLQDEEAGIKSATVLIEGEYAYGYLKSEKGVHRLVRISPFDAARRRHTSFASVDVAPELEDDVSIEIRPEDIRMDTFRASGAGGQYVNRTDSAVRITHIPTGIVVGCQNERSQHMNRQVAMKILRSRLYERAMQERREELLTLQGEKKEVTWGSQIRSYVLHPYTIVKDHRTGHETGNAQAVLDGDIDDFIMSFLRWKLMRH